MPFYLTNENIEATMERNPDDVFNPSDIKQNQSDNNRMIMKLIIEEIQKELTSYTNKSVVIEKPFFRLEAYKEEIAYTYVFHFESTLDAYEIIYYITQDLALLLNDKDLFFTLSDSIVRSLNEQELSYLPDIEVLEFSKKSVLTQDLPLNLVALEIIIDEKSYTLYLSLDDEFNKIF